MGELIVLAERRADRSRLRGDTRPAFFFSLACPFSYLAAERVERLLGEVEWVPVSGIGADHSHEFDALRAAARTTNSASRSRFALAASRLAFCGGFDLEDPEVLAEAAAAAGVALEDCLAAAGDVELDAQLEVTARGLAANGVSELPAVRVGRRFYVGEHRLSEVAAMLRAPAVPDLARPTARAVHRTAREARAMARASAPALRPLAPAG
jgi:2-hydroxychromene-2-carboxylate isomerase